MAHDTSPPPWEPPAPRELPALREALAEQTRSPLEHQALVQLLGRGKGTLSPHTGDLAQDATILLQEERGRLADAVLYYVTADMTRLAMVAATSLPVHSLHPHDVPAERGFLVFAEPIGTYQPDETDNPAEQTQIVAVSWGPSGAVAPDSGVWLTFWAMTDYESNARHIRQEIGGSLDDARRRVRAMRAELTWDNEVVLHWGASRIAVFNTGRPGQALRTEEIDTTSGGWHQVKDSTLGWSHIVRAAWLLMTQPGVTDVDDQPASRTVRRRAERDGFSSPAVRVVRIRHREDTPTRAEPSGRTYSVRWTVRGHWRNQYYPARQEHRPLWINPHIKGPDGAPLRTGQTVHLLDDQGR